jgi:hypothetical protein
MGDNTDVTETTTTHLNSKYATATLVTDTVSFDIVGATDKTVTVRRRHKTDEPGEAVGDEGAYGLRVILHPTESVPNGPLKVYRMRKDGSFRLGDNYGYFRFTNDPPTERVDYRF